MPDAGDLLNIIDVSSHPPRRRESRAMRVTRSLGTRLYRLAVVVAIVWLLHRHNAWLRIEGDAPIQVAEVAPFYPAAAALSVDASERLGLFVLDAQGREIGYALRTAPLCNNVTGYCGPTDTLIAFDPGMKVLGIKVRSSADTPRHVGDVVENEDFMATWNGKTWDELAGMEPHAAGIEGVSGASLTSMCIASGIHERIGRLVAGSREPAWRLSYNDVGLIAVVLVALVFAFTPLRGKTWLRRTFQAVLIGYLGFWNGQLLSISLFTGWTDSGVPWRLAPGLVLLLVAALIVPWGARRPLYCGQICPHGAAQELAGRALRPRWRWKLSRGLDAGLRWLPGLLVALSLAVAMFKLPLDLANIEPFDAYLIRTAGWATIAIAAGGLVASLFVPMAYCKYGCPTGFILSFVRSHGEADSLTRRDLAALVLLLLVAAMYWRYDAIQHWITT